MRAFFAALSFMTILPIPSGGDLRKAPAFFPLVGAILGAILWAISLLLDLLWGKEFSALGVVLGLTALTRGLHLDGLADSVDALLGHREREKVLEIMRDPHIGTFGTLAIVGVILAKFVLLLDLGRDWRALVLFPALGRMAPFLPMYSLPYLRGEGKATPFLPMGKGTLGVGLLFSFSLSLLLLWPMGALVFGTILLYGLAVSLYLKGKLGGMTGDLLGATVETAEVVSLMVLGALR